MSLISRLRAVVAGDDFLDSDFDELDYETSDDFESFNRANKEGITSSNAASLEAEDRIKSVASLKSFYLPYKQMFKIRDNK